MVGGAYAPRHRWRRSIQVARLPSHSQRYCSTHERPGTWKSSPRDQYWSLIKSIANFRTRGPESQEQGVSSSKFITTSKEKRDRRRRASRGLQGPPGASRGLQRTSGAGPPQRFQTPPMSLSSSDRGIVRVSEIACGASRPPGASSRGLGGLQEPHLFQALRTFNVRK